MPGFLSTSHAPSGTRNGAAARPGFTLDEALLPPIETTHDLVALDDALHALAAVHPRKSDVVELRYFGGLSLEETAEALARVDRHGEAGLAVCQAVAPCASSVARELTAKRHPDLTKSRVWPAGKVRPSTSPLPFAF